MEICSGVERAIRMVHTHETGKNYGGIKAVEFTAEIADKTLLASGNDCHKGKDTIQEDRVERIQVAITYKRRRKSKIRLRKAVAANRRRELGGRGLLSGPSQVPYARWISQPINKQAVCLRRSTPHPNLFRPYHSIRTR